MSSSEELKKFLQSYLLENRAVEAASVYRQIIEVEPDFSLMPGVQFDLARCLEQSGNCELALHALERLINKSPKAPISIPARLDAARLCAYLPDKVMEGRRYVDEFLQANPSERERKEAERLKESLASAPAGPSLTPQPFSSNIPVVNGDEICLQNSDFTINPKSHSNHQIPSTPAVGFSIGKAKTESDSDVLLKALKEPHQKEMVQVSLDEVQDALVPSPLPGSGPVIEDIASEMVGEDILFPSNISPANDSNDPLIKFPDINTIEKQDDDTPVDHLSQETPVDKNASEEVKKSGSAVPADRKQPRTASQFLRRAEEMHKRYDEKMRKKVAQKRRLREEFADKSFAIMLPIERKIHPKRIARLLAPYLQRSPQRVLDIMKNGKGLLFENLSLNVLQDLVKITRPVSPELIYVQITPRVTFASPIEVIRLSIDEVGGKAISKNRVIEFDWNDVMLVSCGRIYLDEMRRAGKNVADIFLTRDSIHLRFWDATFNYKASAIPYDPLGERNFANLISFLGESAPESVMFAPTAHELLESDEFIPQRFESLNSYDRYTRWLLYSYYARRVKV